MLSTNTALSRRSSPWSKIVRKTEFAVPGVTGIRAVSSGVAPSYVVPMSTGVWASDMALGPPLSTEMTSPAPPAKLPGAFTAWVAGSTVTLTVLSWATKASLKPLSTYSMYSSEKKRKSNARHEVVAVPMSTRATWASQTSGPNSAGNSLNQLYSVDSDTSASSAKAALPEVRIP